MSNPIRNQSGFTVVEIILGVALLGAISLLGYFAIQNNQKNAVKNTPGKPTPTISASPTPTAFLHIKEMQIKLPLSADILDLTYHYDKAGKTVELSSSSLAGLTDGACAAGPGVGPLETLHQTAELPYGGDTQRIKKVNGYYIWRTPPQAACSQDPQVVELMGKQRVAVHASVDAAKPE